MSRATPWYVAGDEDGAGNSANEKWLALSQRSIRVAPPEGMGKDWTNAYRQGLNLRDWWLPILGGVGTVGSPPVTPEATSTETTASEAEIVPPPEPETSWTEPLPWRAALAEWPDDWREKWGLAANAYEEEGHPWKEAESLAFEEVSAEREAAGGAPPSLPSRPLRGGSGFHALEHTEESWKCTNRFCLKGGRWWRSIHGAILCANCQPPAFPELVAAEGDEIDAPSLRHPREPV
jgi:hypothetical protein